MKNVIKIFLKQISKFWNLFITFPKKIAFNVPTQPSNYYYLEKDNRRRLSFFDFLKFILRNIYLLILSVGIGLGISIPVSPIIAPQTYSGTSYFTVTQVVNVVVYQATADLVTSDLIVRSTIDKLQSNKPFERYSELDLKTIKSGLTTIISDQHFRISVSFSSIIDESVVPVLSYLFDSFNEEVSLHPEKYKDIVRYVVEQERAVMSSPNTSKKPFVILSGLIISLILGLFLSFLIEKKRNKIFSDYFLDRRKYDILCLNKRIKSDEISLICDEYIKSINNITSEISVINLLSNSSFSEIEINKYLSDMNYEKVNLKNVDTNKENKCFIIICSLKTISKTEYYNLNERFRPSGMIVIVS